MSAAKEIETHDTGFKFGAADIRRYASIEGKVWFEIITPKAELEIYVAPGGKIRVWDKKTGKEIDLNSEVKE